jgi:hypothetical protein
MGLFSWWRSGTGADDALGRWRREWRQAVDAEEADAVGRLRAALRATPPLAADLEIEEEMLDGLERLVHLTDELSAGRVPVVDTTHKVVGTDVCHFSAPASMPDDAAQPSGRLLLTGSRAVFIGGPRLTSIAWHATGRALLADRDVMLLRTDAQAAYRFRCNSYADALCGVRLAWHLMDRARTRKGVPPADL